MSELSMKWKFFVGSCILAAGLLIKAGAPVVPIAAGMAIAGLFTWKMQRRPNGSPRSSR
jgi:hypothetical protein